MVLGEFDEHEIEDMASDTGLREFYIDMIKEHGVDESDNVIINLALESLLSDLEQADDSCLVVCKECLIMQYLDLHDVEFGIDDDSDDFDDYCAIAERKRRLTLHDVLNLANDD